MDRVVKGEYLAEAIQSRSIGEIAIENECDHKTIRRYMESFGIVRLPHKGALEGKLEYYRKEADSLGDALTRCLLGFAIAEEKIRTEKIVVKAALDRIVAEG